MDYGIHHFLEVIFQLLWFGGWRPGFPPYVAFRLIQITCQYSCQQDITSLFTNLTTTPVCQSSIIPTLAFDVISNNPLLSTTSSTPLKHAIQTLQVCHLNHPRQQPLRSNQPAPKSREEHMLQHPLQLRSFLRHLHVFRR